jgi:SAM-dependent methyltransferase
VRAEDFEYLYNLEEHYWWFVAMRHITDAIAGPELGKRALTVLDAGCGTGFNMEHYEKQGHSVFALDIADEAIAGVQRRGFRKVVQASTTEIPYRSEAFDFVFSFDVVQQVPVKAAEEAIRELHRVLRPGGGLFIRVAAFEWMRSSHDTELHTEHRYTRSELREMLQAAGFEIQLATYANTLLFPMVVFRRALKRLGIGRGSDVKPLPAASEASILHASRSLPFGLSVICYGHKR